jgi:hypothetical protein
MAEASTTAQLYQRRPCIVLMAAGVVSIAVLRQVHAITGIAGR